MKDTTRRLRKLGKQEVERLRDRFVTSINPRDVQDPAHFAALQVPTRVDLPLGELANPEMSGLINVWSMTRTFIHGEITSQHQFNAQGIEGLVSIEDVPLSMALLAAKKTGIYRIEIFVPHGWTSDLLSGIEDDVPEGVKESGQ